VLVIFFTSVWKGHSRDLDRPSHSIIAAYELLLIVIMQGINIFRFANRIPLLFEQGGDVVTRTAMKRIK
jgi:hypothetical protein